MNHVVRRQASHRYSKVRRSIRDSSQRSAQLGFRVVGLTGLARERDPKSGVYVLLLLLLFPTTRFNIVAKVDPGAKCGSMGTH
jgi:hypothetical protein